MPVCLRGKVGDELKATRAKMKKNKFYSEGLVPQLEKLMHLRMNKARFRFHTDTGISGMVKAGSFEEAKKLMESISLDPIIEKKGFSFDDANVIYPMIIVNSKPY